MTLEAFIADKVILLEKREHLSIHISTSYKYSLSALTTFNETIEKKKTNHGCTSVMRGKFS